MTPRPTLTLPELMQMDGPTLHRRLCEGHPLDPAALAGHRYLGVDLSLPGWGRKLLWHTFRKTFTRDHPGDDVRGWNVRMEQRGIDAPQEPLRDHRGEPITFGHYRVRSAAGLRFPRGWTGGHYLDYGVAGNALLDPGRFGYTPLVAVNEGSMELLLGWEVFRVGPALLPLPLYYALRLDGPLEHIVPPPRSPG